MKDLEKQIEEAAKINAGFDPRKEIDYDERYYNGHNCDKYDSFISGAKSQAAKEYWQQGMYSEEEVKALIQKFNKEQCASTWYDDDEYWFEQNKKK